MWDFLPSLPPRIQGPKYIHVVRRDQTVALAQDLQWYTVLSRAPPGILCRAVKDLCRCPTPLIERDDLLDASMLEVGRSSLWLPITLQRRPGYWVRNQSPRRSGQQPCIPPTDLKGHQSLRELSVWGWWPMHRGSYDQHHQDSQSCWLLNQGHLPLRMWIYQLVYPGGAQLDLTSLWSMQMIITQNTLMGELEYHYETRVISQTSLHLTLPDYPDQPNTHQELEEPWASKPLINSKKKLKLSEYLLMKPNKTWN